jgi:hypothetical protein
LGHNLFSDAPSFALDPTDLINTDPLLAPLADNGGPTPTMALLPGSPAIDAGVSVSGVTTDQRGVPRPQGSAPDIGAFEFRYLTTSFDSLAAPTITYGTPAVTLSGHIAAGTYLPAGNMSITLNNVTQLAAIDPSSGQFSSVFTASGLHASSSPYAITYRYAGDIGFNAATATTALAVTPVPLTIAANDATKVYGATMPMLTASYNGFVNGDTAASLATPPTLTTPATASSHVQAGGYPITASGASDPDYIISYQSSTLLVTPAPLTIIADDKTVAFGTDPPTLTASCRGFVNGDGMTSLTRPVVVSTTAAAYSPPGRYAIIASGAASSDYVITLVNGTLTVTQPQARYERGCVAFVTSLYRDMLGRAAEPAGVRFWMRRMDAGARVNNIARQIWTSREHRSLVRHHAAPKIRPLAAFNHAVRAWSKAARSKT